MHPINMYIAHLRCCGRPSTQVIHSFLYFVAPEQTWLSDFTFTFHFHALEKEMATRSSVLAWRIPGMGSHRVGHDWSDLAAAERLCCAVAWDETALGHSWPCALWFRGWCRQEGPFKDVDMLHLFPNLWSGDNSKPHDPAVRVRLV